MLRFGFVVAAVVALVGCGAAPRAMPDHIDVLSEHEEIQKLWVELEHLEEVYDGVGAITVDTDTEGETRYSIDWSDIPLDDHRE